MRASLLLTNFTLSAEEARIQFFGKQRVLKTLHHPIEH